MIEKHLIMISCLSLLLSGMVHGLEEGRLTLSKSTVLMGEVLSFTLTNTGDLPIKFLTPNPWKIVDGKGALVFAPATVQILVELAPGSSRTWNWDLKDLNDRPVPSGHYSVIVESVNAGAFKKDFEVVEKAIPGFGAEVIVAGLLIGGILLAKKRRPPRSTDTLRVRRSTL